ncbi:hypothetical protein ACIKTA_12195, partial [Hansschlegelia beijingensis]
MSGGAFPYGVVPKMRPLPARRAVVVSVLDVGTSKIACLVARLRPVDHERGHVVLRAVLQPAHGRAALRAGP